MIEDNKRIAIVILNYNGLNLLKKFLPSVVNFSDYKISSIYLVDNCSKDDFLMGLELRSCLFKVLSHSDSN